MPGLLATFSINDSPSVNFLVETGVSISILPPNVCVSENVHPSPLDFLSAPFGPFQYTQMPFVLRNASQTFQRFVNQMLGDLPFVTLYIDDILIHSNTNSEHGYHVQQVFQRLSEYNLHFSPTKFIFVVDQVGFLGCSISADGLRPQT